MKILLDNCVHYKTKTLLPGHVVTHTSDIGWENFRNGHLIAQAASRFEVLLSTDKKIRNEQNLSKLPVPVIEVNTLFTRFEDMKSVAPYFESALEATKRYRFVSISPDGTLELLGEILPPAQPPPAIPEQTPPKPPQEGAS